MEVREIGDPLFTFFRYLAGLVSYCFVFLDSIKVLGVPLLRIFISFTVLGAVFSLIFTVAKGSVIYHSEIELSRRYKKHKSSRNKSKKG